MRLPLLVLLVATLAPAQEELSVRLYWRYPSHPEAKTITLSLEEYAAGAVAGEANTFRSDEALKAMAVVARTYAIHFRGRHKSEGFDLCATTHCQDLRLEAVSDRVRQAVNETQGEMLWYEGHTVAPFHHRHCGGTTEAAAALWPEETAPYLRQQPDTFCLTLGQEDWSAELSSGEFEAALEAFGIQIPPKSLRLEVADRTPSGRVRSLLVSGQPVSAEQFHALIGRTLGWRLLRSAFYDVSQRENRFLFHGHGSGHGVGLCQVGADNRGLAGRGYRQILSFYYPGSVVGVAASGFRWTRLGGERIEVFSTDPNQDGELVRLADRLLPEAERRSEITTSIRPRIYIYPDVSAFRDATGEPGWVAASTAGRNIRLQPLAKLRSTGSLDAILRHEFLHLLIESAASPSVPWWFHEGYVAYLETTEPPAPPPPLSEDRLENPRTQQELRDAYAIAKWRVHHLAGRYGEQRLREWLRSGLPGNIVISLRQNSPGHRSQH